jgi:DNA-binding NarL/FixJ family response regulator
MIPRSAVLPHPPLGAVPNPKFAASRLPEVAPMPISLLIADDHPLIRAGLRRIFGRTGIAVAGEAASIAEAIEGASDPGVDVVLLDLRWINGGGTATEEAGLHILGKIRAARDELGILMYSSVDAPSCIARCRELGADGYLIKGVDDATLPAAVRAVHAGDQIWPAPRPAYAAHGYDPPSRAGR